jgi:uncharacterized SAM-binding protein YcdF (DUF218 family)
MVGRQRVTLPARRGQAGGSSLTLQYLSANLRVAWVVLYVVSKAFWLVAQPVHLLILLLTLAAVLSCTRWRRLGVALAAFVVLLALIVTVLPVGSWLLSPLENRFPPLRQMPAHVDGIIMLGGDESIAFTDLARRYPKAKLVLTGGGPNDQGKTFQEADIVGKRSQWLGIDTHRIIFERQSRNTFEDVCYAKAIVHPAPGETWILITGASHMPRSVGLFRGQGWQVVPYPADSITGAGPDDPRSRFDFAQNLDQLTVALKEWFGMLANRWLGHSDEYFPGPDSPSAAEAVPVGHR